MKVRTRDDAVALDDADLLAPFRDEFVIADPALIYLDGNSLGMLPRRTIERLERVVGDEWGGGLIRSWDHWIDLPQRVGDRLAPLIGAAPGEVVVHDSTTVNLYQLVDAACALRPDRRVIAISPNDFPTDRYVVDGIAAARGLHVRAGFDGLDDVAVMVRSVVDYRTAEVADVAGETARARSAGALALWDLSHAAGVVATDLTVAGAQLAVGCTYKYLNGGPGSPAFSYVARELQPMLPQPIWGWFAQTEQFRMGATFAPQPDMRRLLLGTPSVLAMVCAEEGIALTAAAGIESVQAKAQALTQLALDLCEERGLTTTTPRQPSRRGGHVAVQHPDAGRLVGRLAAGGVITDFRDPDIVRIGCSPLTTRFVDVFDGVTALDQLVQRT
ncbi:MAG: kynureninase [Ilumatobacteraceae bacterium]|nr:kynureninase [Ilumatobacteraceae bacterium]